MSRGGRGRGRGRGGSNAARDQFSAAFAGMSKDDTRALMESFSKPVKGSGMLYPPLDKPSELPGPTALEERVVHHQNEMMRDLAEGPVGPDGERGGAPWRLASERKVVGIEIESYSDRYRRQPASSSGTTKLSAPALRLQADMFPPSLWKEYFENDSSDAQAARARQRQQRRKRALDGDEDDGAAAESDGSEDADEGDFDFDDEEDEDHQDYDANYFDNGEGDDDSGGEGGEDDGGRGYDD